MTLIGVIMNSHLFNPTKDKYYAMFLLKMDPREYALSNYGYFLLKSLLGLGASFIVCGLLVGLRLPTCILMAFLSSSARSVFTVFCCGNLSGQAEKHITKQTFAKNLDSHIRNIALRLRAPADKPEPQRNIILYFDGARHSLWSRGQRISLEIPGIPQDL